MSPQRASTSSVELTVRLGGEKTIVEFPAEAVAASCPVTKVGERLFRLDAVPLFTESAGYRDVIEAEQMGEGRLRFVRVVEPSGWRMYDFILPPHRIDSERGQKLLRELEARGGYWERMFSGLLFICIPPELDLDPTPWVMED
jgi:hypothetical protein